MLHAIKLLAYELPKVLAKALPVGILLGTIFTFDKLSKDSELSILRGIGLSFTRIMMPAVILGTVLTYLCFMVGDFLIPYASKAEGENKSFQTNFVYIQKDENNIPKRGIIISNYIPGLVRKLFIVDFSKETYDDAITFENIYFADWAKVKKDNWTLYGVKKYRISSGGIYENIKDVGSMNILEGKEASEIYELMTNTTKRDRTFTNSELKRYMKLLSDYGYLDEYRFMLTKYYQRFLHPLTCILFAIIGCLLGFSPPRSQRLVGFTVAVGIVFAYYITLPFFDLLAQKGVLPPFVSAFLPILMFLLAIVYIKKYKDV